MGKLHLDVGTIGHVDHVSERLRPSSPSMLDSRLVTPGDATCPNHPDVRALGNCQRCGTFFCAADRRDVDGVAYCQPCGVRPDVDWLEAYRQSLLGKRDGWVWFLGISAPGYTVLAAGFAANGVGIERLLAIPALGSAITGALFFFGKPLARILLVVSTLFWGALQLATIGPWSLVGTTFAALFVVTALSSTRNRLYFRLDVSREKLKKDYERLADNPMARNAFALGLLSLIVPFVGPIAIIMGVLAFQRVDRTARPPIGKGAYALTGVGFGVLGCLIGVMWIVFGLSRPQ